MMNMRELDASELALVEGGLIQVGLMAGIAAFGVGFILGAVIVNAIMD